jgi:hypothetical protein
VSSLLFKLNSIDLTSLQNASIFSGKALASKKCVRAANVAGECAFKAMPDLKFKNYV